MWSNGWSSFLNLISGKKNKTSAKKEKTKNFFSKTNEQNVQNEQGGHRVKPMYNYMTGIVTYDLTSDPGFSDVGRLPSTRGTRGARGMVGARGASGISGMRGKSYAEFLMENVGRNIEYSEYIAEKVDGNIRYSDYLSEQLDENISYSSYMDDFSYEYEDMMYNNSFESFMRGGMTLLPNLVTKCNVKVRQVYDGKTHSCIITGVYKQRLLDMNCPISVSVIEKKKGGMVYEKGHDGRIHSKITRDVTTKTFYTLEAFETRISNGDLVYQYDRY